jgi:DNA-binding NarL/FixJ family response regulator
MACVGMEEVLASGGIEVVNREAPALSVVAAARELQPDAVVLGMDEGDARRFGEHIRAVAPSAKLILWARDENSMEVFDPGCPAARRVTLPQPRALVGELVRHPHTSGRS